MTRDSIAHSISEAASALCCCGLLLSGAFAAGCGAARPSRYYELTVPHETGETGDDPPATNRYNVSLLLGPLRASHLYREDRIVYGTSSEHMGTYEYQRWAEPPTEMIEEVLLRELRASGRFKEVHGMRSNAVGDYLLHGRLFEFKEITGPPLVGRVEIGLELRDVKTGATVWDHFYSHDEPAGGKDISAVVAALNRNVHRGIGEFQASLDHYFSTHPPAALPATPPQ